MFIYNVLSLFDGISCAQLALRRAGIKYLNYYASEIDKTAIKVANYHFKDTIQLGDVTRIKGCDLPKIDLLVGGSPCQGFSFAGKGLNFDDPRSKLFFDFVRLVDETKPRYFMLENVCMEDKHVDVISSYLGVTPVMIDSRFVSAQMRRRLYWANFDITQPADKNIMLVDILDDTFENKNYTNKAVIVGRRLNERGHRDDYNKNFPITQCLEVRATNTNKSNCLTTVDKDNVLTSLPFGRYPDAFKNKLPFRYYTIKEKCRLQTIPDDYFDGLCTYSAVTKMLGNGWNVDTVAHIFECMKLNENNHG